MPEQDTTSYDLCGLKCPMPIVRLNKIIKSMAVDETCRIVADDPAFAPDVEAWCRKTGHALLQCEHEEEGIVAVIRKES